MDVQEFFPVSNNEIEYFTRLPVQRAVGPFTWRFHLTTRLCARTNERTKRNDFPVGLTPPTSDARRDQAGRQADLNMGTGAVLNTRGARLMENQKKGPWLEMSTGKRFFPEKSGK